MKRKVLKAILLLCVVMAMTACGGNADKVEGEETTVTEENAYGSAKTTLMRKLL